MELVIKSSSLPLRGYPHKDLDKFLYTEFKFWLSSLLNIKAENEDQVDISIECIKNLCKGYSLTQLKEMFELYTHSKLDLEPITNYVDCVLIGKIVKSYRSYVNRLNTSNKDVEKYKKDQDNFNVILLFDDFVQKDKIHNDFVWVYTYLVSLKVLNPSDDLKKRKYNIFLEKLEHKKPAIIASKISILEDFFRQIYIKGKHIKDFI